MPPTKGVERSPRRAAATPALRAGGALRRPLEDTPRGRRVGPESTASMSSERLARQDQETAIAVDRHGQKQHIPFRAPAPRGRRWRSRGSAQEQLPILALLSRLCTSKAPWMVSAVRFTVWSACSSALTEAASSRRCSLPGPVAWNRGCTSTIFPVTCSRCLPSVPWLPRGAPSTASWHWRRSSARPSFARWSINMATASR